MCATWVGEWETRRERADGFEVVARLWCVDVCVAPFCGLAHDGFVVVFDVCGLAGFFDCVGLAVQSHDA